MRLTALDPATANSSPGPGLGRSSRAVTLITGLISVVLILSAGVAAHGGNAFLAAMPAFVAFLLWGAVFPTVRLVGALAAAFLTLQGTDRLTATKLIAIAIIVAVVL